MTIQPEAGGVCHGFSIRQSWSNTFQVVEMSGKAPPHHPWDARCVARSTTPLRTGFESFAFNHCMAWVKRRCSKIMVPQMSTDSPEIFPKGKNQTCRSYQGTQMTYNPPGSPRVNGTLQPDPGRVT